MTPEQYRARAEDAKKEASAARAAGDTVAASFWDETARGYLEDAAFAEAQKNDGTQAAVVPPAASAPTGSAPAPTSDVSTAPPDAGLAAAVSAPSEQQPSTEAEKVPTGSYYYYDATSSQWVNTDREDALRRKQSGQQILEPPGGS